MFVYRAQDGRACAEFQKGITMFKFTNAEGNEKFVDINVDACLKARVEGMSWADIGTGKTLEGGTAERTATFGENCNQASLAAVRQSKEFASAVRKYARENELDAKELLAKSVRGPRKPNGNGGESAPSAPTTPTPSAPSAPTGLSDELPNVTNLVESLNYQIREAELRAQIANEDAELKRKHLAMVLEFQSECAEACKSRIADADEPAVEPAPKPAVEKVERKPAPKPPIPADEYELPF